MREGLGRERLRDLRRRLAPERGADEPPGLEHLREVDAGFDSLVRPAMYEAWMQIVPCVQRDAPTLVWDVVGPVCESGDWLGRERALAVAPGDHVAVLSAGAYAMSMASNYNGARRPAAVMAYCFARRPSAVTPN